MRTKILTIVFVLYSIGSFAAPGWGQPSCKKFYLGISTGINNQSGLVGVNFDIPVTSQFSLGTGLGLSSWGLKTYAEGRFYFRECNRGWALGAGITYNTGLENISTDLPTTTGTKSVLMDWEPSTNAMLSGYHFFNLGRGGHRFYLQLGYSYRLDDNIYTIKSPDILTADGKTAMDIVKPGGVIFAFGFSFGLGR